MYWEDGGWLLWLDIVIGWHSCVFHAHHCLHRKTREKMFLPDVPGLVFDVLQTQKLRDLYRWQSVSDIHLVSKEEDGDPSVLNVWRQRWKSCWQTGRLTAGGKGWWTKTVWKEKMSLKFSILDPDTKIKSIKEMGWVNHRPGWFSNVSSSSLATTILSLSALSMTNMIACPSLRNKNRSQDTALSHQE